MQKTKGYKTLVEQSFRPRCRKYNWERARATRPRRISQEGRRLNWLSPTTMVRTRSSTADLATSRECAESMPLTPPYAIPRNNLMRGLLLFGPLRSFIVREPMRIAATATAVPTIHSTNCHLPRRSRSSSRLCAGSFIAPKLAINPAPPATSIVPASEYRVKGSPSIRVAHIELKTRPDFDVLIRSS